MGLHSTELTDAEKEAKGAAIPGFAVKQTQRAVYTYSYYRYNFQCRAMQI